jgi:hypothetical protein
MDTKKHMKKKFRICWVVRDFFLVCLVVAMLLTIILLAGPSISFGHCASSLTIETWKDDNTNGIWEDSEQPLSGVAFRIYNKQLEENNEMFSLDSPGGQFPLSSEQGKSSFLAYSAWPCSQVYVTAIAPTGYYHTTPSTVDTTELGAKKIISFGFSMVER